MSLTPTYLSDISASSMGQRNSSSAQALLGLLTIEPMSGYDLRQTIEASIGHMWSESFGQIYPNLRRLAAAGLAQRKSEGRKGKRDRHVYSITRKGRTQLAEWLALPAQPEVPRNEMLLKLFFGAQVAPEISIAHVQRMAEQHRAVLEQFK